MEIIVEITLLLFVVSFVIFCFTCIRKPITRYGKAVKLLSFLYLAGVISVFLYFKYVNKETGCNENIDSFYENDGNLCYKHENYSSVIATKQNNRELKVTEFTITSPDRAIIKLDDGSKAVVYSINDKRIFGPYYGNE